MAAFFIKVVIKIKKLIIISFLILLITGSIFAGTLANYTITLDNLAAGSVIAKEFIFLETGSDNFTQDLKIAPTDLVEWQFGVKNFNEQFVTETDMYYKITINAAATPGKNPIDPLEITIKDENQHVIGIIEGTGSLNIYNFFPLSTVGQSHYYTVEIYWPSNKDVDINYAGHNFGTSINVSAVASQVPFEQEPSTEPEVPGEPQPQPFVEVSYKVVKSWISNGVWDPETQTVICDNYHEFDINITNLSDQPINGWELAFNYSETINSIWHANIKEHNPSANHYIIENLSWNSVINPGETLTLGGIATGNGENIQFTSANLNGVGIEILID
ncbi:MAG TPA: sugar-binding protein [Clostridiales bacterium]|nr:sugar-binding protein [Clostridiales bacterium]